MAGFGRYKLTDALPSEKQTRKDRAKAAKTGSPGLGNSTTAAEQAREAQASQTIKHAGTSIRERMVDIGRGNQQDGRQGGKQP